MVYIENAPLYGAGEVVGSLFAGAALLVLVLVFVAVVSKLMRNNGSRYYRRHLGNLFVASKIRQYADKSNIDLEAEEARYMIFCRKNSMKEIKDFDSKILEQLNAQIDKDIEDIDAKQNKQDKKK